MPKSNPERDNVIYQQFMNGATIDELATAFNVHRSNISRAISRVSEANCLNDGIFSNRVVAFLAEKNGESQDIFVMEEMAELQKELTKRRRGKDNRDAIVEESVDVLITVYTLLRAYGATEIEISDIVGKKLARVRDPLIITEARKDGS